MRGTIWVCLQVLLMTVILAPKADAGVYFPETFKLKNGMQVVVVSNHRAPVVNHMVWYKVGAADEPVGKSGIAHYLEHLMFKGTETTKPGEFSELVARNGGRDNAFTGQDFTGYFQTIAKDRLEMVMRYEADRMTNLTLDPELIEPERSVVLEERRSRVENDPGSILQEQSMAAFYLNYPYKVPIIGWEDEIKALTVDDIVTFYKDWYGPANAILVVTGDITAEELKPLAEKYYGSIPDRAVKVRNRVAEPDHRAERTVVLRDQRVTQPQWVRMYKAPSYLYGDTTMAYPLQVLENIAGDGATSRLYRTLVVERKIALQAGLSYDPMRTGPTQFAVYAIPAAGVSMDALAEAVDEELAKIIEDGVTEDEIARAKSRMTSAAIYARDSLSGGAWALGSALASGLDIDTVESWPERIEAVTKSDVDAVAKRVFTEQKPLIYQLLPKEGV